MAQKGPCDPQKLWPAQKCRVRATRDDKEICTFEFRDLAEANEMAEALIEEFHDVVVSVKTAFCERLYWYES